MSAASVSEEVRARVRAAAGDRCGYCLSPQHLVLGRLEIDHLVPSAAGGANEEENLWLACRLCNNYKAMQTEALDPATEKRVRLFDPRREKWAEHFAWNEEGTRILGLTLCGRATVIALQLNDWIAVMVRGQWVAAGWHPPKTATETPT